MALTKAKKQSVVDEVAELLATSKMTVVAAYPGTTVKALQQLRREAKADGTVVKVAKNRLVIKAVQSNQTLKDADTSALTGQLIYAFNPTDEVAPAKAFATFAKTNPTLQFVGAISTEGKFLSAEEITALATLPSKNQLIAGIINTLQSPTHGVVGALKGNLHGLLDAIAAKTAEA